MKIGRLYIKIFLNFSLILIITLLLTFALFILFPGRYFQDRFIQYTRIHATLVKTYLEEKIRSGADGSVSREQLFRDFTQKMGEMHDAKFWITNAQGEVLAKSFAGNIPKESETKFSIKMDEKTEAFEVEREFGRKHGLHMSIPIAAEDEETFNLHAFFEPPDASRYSAGFALGLLVIGIFVALLVIPVTRRITRPLDGLRRSALRFSKGDLSHRTDFHGKDEIAQLARAFNVMAERLERMIKGGKELTANVSHELRSPLARIRVAEEIMRRHLKKGRPEDMEKHLNNIQEDIRELDRLIGRILEFSKLDLHEESFEKASLNLSAILRKLLERFETVMAKKKVAVEMAIPESVFMTGDEKDLASAFSNLLDNAAKFVPREGKWRCVWSGCPTIWNFVSLTPMEN